MRKFALSAVAVSTLAMSALAAQAASLTITDISGAWTGWSGGTAVSSSSSGSTAQLRWGTPTSGQSGYDFTPSGTPFAPSEDAVFDLGRFTHNNFIIDANSAIDSATLDVSFTFYLGDDPTNLITRTSQFEFDHWETTNNANPCADGGSNGSGVNVNGCADRVLPTTNPSTSETFTITENGVTETYVFDVTGFNIGSAFWTTEEMSNSATLQARWTSETSIAPIPLPAAAWMLMAGVGSLVWTKRRRRS